jgi:hypothetical protein
MTGSLPAPGAVLDRAADLGAGTERAAADSGVVNVHVPPTDGGFDPATVDLGPDGYEGPNAGDLGRLAAAVGAVEQLADGGTGAARLHHPDPVAAAPGPWLVVEPLDGRLSTVHAGRGRLAVDLVEPPAGVDAGLRAVREALADLLDTVRPEHRRYPVGRDADGVFTRGMTTLSLDRVEARDGAPTVRFDVSTTPETDPREVEGLVAGLSCVREARYEPVAALCRSEPPSSLLRAAEGAAERAVGDWEYEWYPEPTVFSRLSTAAKLALGTGTPGEGSFGAEDYRACRTLLGGTVADYGGR